MRLAPDGEIQFRGRTVFGGYWNAPDATAAAFTDDGWYRTGDIGHLDAAGRLILSGRTKDIIVLPNGFNVYPEDIENALRVAGIRDSVVVETQPGRIEAIVLGAVGEADPGELRAGIDAAVKAANATLGPEPADRRLAALARRGLPADAHAQGQARPGPRLGGGRHAAAGRLTLFDRVPHPERLERGLDARRARIVGGLRQPVVDDDRGADAADDVDRPLGRLDLAGPVAR